MKQILSRAWTAPLFLLFVTIATYGLLIPKLGFYWDDWPKVWFLHTLGPSGFKQVYAIDRPFLAWTYMITTPIFEERPLNWQIFELFCHWLSAISVLWTLKIIWPNHAREALWTALLFLVYPGFSQHSISLIYSHYFLILALFIFSLGTMVLSIRKPRWFWQLTVVSILTSVYCIFSIEYFSGLELLRPILLWWTLSESPDSPPPRKRLLRSLALWSPYLAISLIFVLWRVWVIRFPTYQPLLLESFIQKPWLTLIHLLQTTVSDVIEVSIYAWAQVFRPPTVMDFGLKSTLMHWGLVVFIAISITTYLIIGKRTSSNESASSIPMIVWSKQAFITALASLLVGGLPIWIAKLPMSLDFPEDRFTLPMMFGVSLLIASVFSLLRCNNLLKIIIVGLMVGLASGKQFQFENEFRRAWEDQKRFFHQLSLRVPGLAQGTTIVINKESIIYASDNSLTAPINWIYSPNNSSTEMGYMLYDLNVRLGLGLGGLKPDTPIHQKYRATSFDGSTSQLLAIYYAPPRCLRVADPILDDSLPIMGGTFSQAVALSRIDLINLDADPEAYLPEKIVGPRPVLTSWCDYFEKADLARQKGDWQQIVELGEIAFSLNDKPNEASERIPFIEGYANVGYWEQAWKLTNESIQQDESVGRALCQAWSRIERTAKGSEEGKRTIRQVKDELACTN